MNGAQCCSVAQALVLDVTVKVRLDTKFQKVFTAAAVSHPFIANLARL